MYGPSGPARSPMLAFPWRRSAASGCTARKKRGEIKDMKQTPINLYWLYEEDCDKGRLVFAASADSAIHRFGPELSGDAATVKSRLVVSGVTLFRVVWSGFIPRQADIPDLKALDFEVSESGIGQRISRLGAKVFIDEFTLNDRVMAEHDRERADAEPSDYRRNQ